MRKKYPVNKKVQDITLNYFMRKHGYDAVNLAEAVGLGRFAMAAYIKSPLKMPLTMVISLAGLFNVKVEVLTYLIIRNQGQVKTNAKNGAWYIEEVEKDIDIYIQTIENK